jgi:hypothetical protein
VLGLGAALADDFAALCSDRAAIERVYHQHRLGDKRPFEQALPRATLERLVRDDLRKEAALQKAYGVEITPAMLDSEVQRINATTRAPDILAELKAALGNDTNRFARTVAKPIVVERLLRERFDNDDALHAAQRREAERIRAQLLQAPTGNSELRGPKSETTPKSEVRSPKSEAVVSNLVAMFRSAAGGQFTETTWQLAKRPADKPGMEQPDEAEIRRRFGPNAQILSSPHGADKGRKFYFEDLPGELQNVLRVQLRQPGDVSAVIEMPTGFLVYVCKERTAENLSVAALSLPKRGYEQWLAEQDGGKK